MATFRTLTARRAQILEQIAALGPMRMGSVNQQLLPYKQPDGSIRRRGPYLTMMDMGVARPRVHGQAMMRTATALMMACASLGSGPSHIQRAKVSTENRLYPGIAQ